MSFKEDFEFNNTKEALVYIAQKLGAIEEINRDTQREIILLRKDFLKFVKYIIVLSILAICALAGVRLIIP